MLGSIFTTIVGAVGQFSPSSARLSRSSSRESSPRSPREETSHVVVLSTAAPLGDDSNGGVRSAKTIRSPQTSPRYGPQNHGLKPSAITANGNGVYQDNSHGVVVEGSLPMGKARENGQPELEATINGRSVKVRLSTTMAGATDSATASEGNDSKLLSGSVGRPARSKRQPSRLYADRRENGRSNDAEEVINPSSREPRSPRGRSESVRNIHSNPEDENIGNGSKPSRANSGAIHTSKTKMKPLNTRQSSESTSLGVAFAPPSVGASAGSAGAARSSKARKKKKKKQGRKSSKDSKAIVKADAASATAIVASAPGVAVGARSRSNSTASGVTIQVNPPVVAAGQLQITDLEKRILPKEAKLLTEERHFDENGQKIDEYRVHLEKQRLALRSGTRTLEQALSEFKAIRANERVASSEAEGANKKRKKVNKDDADEGGEEACKCSEKDACGDEHCLNRCIQIECNPKLCPVELKRSGACQNMRIHRGNKARTEVRVISDKGCGLFAVDRIPRGSLVNEYIGEIIDENECNRRLETVYVEEKHKYLMCMKGGLLIDATRRGNVARFINHSCEPNCLVQEWTVREQPRMCIFALREIQPGQEITFNYNFQRFGEEPQQCHCGAPSCRGRLGRKVGDSESGDDEDSANIAQKRKRVKLGYDPVLGDIVGKHMKEAAAHKAEIHILNVLDSGVPKQDASRARSEGLFLVRNVHRAIHEIYREGGRMGWKS